MVNLSSWTDAQLDDELRQSIALQVEVQLLIDHGATAADGRDSLFLMDGLMYDRIEALRGEISRRRRENAKKPRKL